MSGKDVERKPAFSGHVVSARGSLASNLLDGRWLDLKSDLPHFCVQAFKIVPYNTETLDKLLTESLKNNIPASGLHLFGINQLEEEDMMTSKSEIQTSCGVILVCEFQHPIPRCLDPFGSLSTAHSLRMVPSLTS